MCFETLGTESLRTKPVSVPCSHFSCLQSLIRLQSWCLHILASGRDTAMKCVLCSVVLCTQSSFLDSKPSYSGTSMDLIMADK